MAIQIKRSSTPGAVPTLVAGQLGINDADGKLFWRDSGGTVRSTVLNLGTAAGKNVGTGSSDVVAGDDPRLSAVAAVQFYGRFYGGG